MNMKILFAGGGTAGHINPALAVAGYVRQQKPQDEILFVGSRGGMEERLVPQAGFDFCTITVSGFIRKLNLHGIRHNLMAVRRIFTATAEAKRILQRFAPDICVGTGGYVSGPVLRKAAKMGIPIIIHEQNAFPGVTTKMLSKLARKVMLAVPDAESKLEESVRPKVVVTGNPVRTEVIFAQRDAARRELGLDNRPVILSFGGSLGAENINRAMAEVIVRGAADNRYQHIHAYGQYGKWFPDLLREKGVDPKQHKNLDIREYIQDMPRCLAAADLVICRSGAITLSELQVQGKPSILIPSPNVAENHQYYNALALVNRGAAKMIEEKDLTGELLFQTTAEMLSEPQKLKEYGRNAQKMAIADANERIYELIRQTVSHA